MLLQFTDKTREGFEQSRTDETVKLYVYGIGFIVVKLEQMKIVNLNLHGDITNATHAA